MGSVSDIKLIRTDECDLFLQKMFSPGACLRHDTKMSKSTANKAALKPRTQDICREAARTPLCTDSQVVHTITINRGN